MIVIVDYGMGNIFSVVKKVRAYSDSVVLSSDPTVILSADKLILPGVGSFGKAMDNLKSMGLIEALNKAVLEQQTPVLGICLGMQLMSTFSEEGDAKGLNWIPGEVKKFQFKDTLRFKAPHSGWNQVKRNIDHPIFKDINDSQEFYFVHSYYYTTDSSDNILAESIYESEFCCSVVKGHIIGMQFHPEKSHDQGAQLIKNFIEEI